MAKSSRSSTRKTNNQRLKKNVFGPTEDARAERLSAKLLELASLPKPEKETEMEDVAAQDAQNEKGTTGGGEQGDDTMDIDSKPSQRIGKKKIEKRRKKKSSIVFPKYKERTGGSKKKR
ncbi:hypothetical protein NKR23_g10103 [Pleurostoma richardsiae]|uniref:DUF2423 domain-containing protein n=1 Tax=Pleurostoma richardsiae TaxID=41990 RepID=A0AA38R5P6_9PEZI|nr:hypothetical protein NKR23_g10103 [Pleurostoma richardsiae]